MKAECVRCGASLPKAGRCETCGAEDVMLANTRVSLPSLDTSVRAWREGFGMMLGQQRRQLDQLRAVQSGAFSASRPRLDALSVAIEGQLGALQSLFERVGLPPLPPPRRAPRFNPHMGYVQLLRDWAWPDDVQNTDAARLMLQHRPKAEWGDVLVLGSGAGGLAAELHGHGAARTVALDLNPLPLLVFDRLLARTDVDLWEFPAYPSQPGAWAIRHRLRQPGRTDGLTTWIADALALPFTTGSFDVVVTHWFLDRVGRDPATVASLVHRLLRPGGAWINRGPLLYEGAREWFGRPDIDETVAWTRALGFDASTPTADTVGYLNSPWSTQRRREVVYTFAAVKQTSEDWLEDETLPVPVSASRTAAQSNDPISVWCARQADGSRSISRLAQDIRAKSSTSYAAAREGVRERLHRSWSRA